MDSTSMNRAQWDVWWLRARHWAQKTTTLLFAFGFCLGVLVSGFFFSSLDHPPNSLRSLSTTKQIAALNHETPSAQESDYLTPPEFIQANIFLANNQCPQAISLYQELLKRHPQSTALYNNWAVCAQRMGQMDTAQRLLQKAINARDDARIPHENLSQLYRHLAELSYKRVEPGIDILNAPPKITTSPSSKSPSLMVLAHFDLTSPTVDLPSPTTIASVIPSPTPAQPTKATPQPPTPTPNPTAINHLTSVDSRIKQSVEHQPTIPINLPPPERLAQSTKAPPQPPKTEPSTPANIPDKNKTAQSEASAKNKERLLKQAALQRAINEWAKDWSTKNMNDYFDHYAKSFKPSGGMAKSAWREDRINKIIGKKSISVTATNIKVEFSPQGESATVRFTQSYKADGIDLTARKSLRMVLEGRQWKISEENVQ